jgi:hypothetical protein
VTITSRVTLRAEAQSLYKSKLGSVSGQIYIETDKGDFPGSGWNDLILPVLCAWLSAVFSLADGSAREGRVYFMDGPYYVDFNRLDEKTSSLRLVEDRSDGLRLELAKSTATLRRKRAPNCRFHSSGVRPKGVERFRTRQTAQSSHAGRRTTLGSWLDVRSSYPTFAATLFACRNSSR